MSDAYDLGFGLMCAEVFEGDSAESCAQCSMRDELGSAELRSESLIVAAPQL